MDDCAKRHSVVLRQVFCQSWSGVSRPSSLLSRRDKDLDARDERGHGGGKVMRSPRDAP
jgi:hypothetical protein